MQWHPQQGANNPHPSHMCIANNLAIKEDTKIPSHTCLRGCFIAITAAMRKVLSPAQPDENRCLSAAAASHASLSGRNTAHESSQNPFAPISDARMTPHDFRNPSRKRL